MSFRSRVAFPIVVRVWTSRLNELVFSKRSCFIKGQVCEEEWKLATDLQKKQLDEMTIRAFRSAYVKFRKDVNGVLAMEDSEAIVPLSNKHQESFFAYYKRYEQQFLHMTDGMIEIVAKAKLNKVTFLN